MAVARRMMTKWFIALCLMVPSADLFAYGETLSFRLSSSGTVQAVVSGLDDGPACQTEFVAPSSVIVSGNTVAISSPYTTYVCTIPPPSHPYQVVADLGVLTGSSYQVTWTEGPLNVSATLVPSVLGMSSVPALSYARELYGAVPTLNASVQTLNALTGQVVINGGDSSAPAKPFTFAWGDGTFVTGWFPQSHVYTDTARNYVASVTANYSSLPSDTVNFPVRFVASQITGSYPPTVSIPTQVPNLTSRQPGYVPPATLAAFDDSYFNPLLPRAVATYVLSRGAYVEAVILEGDVEAVDGNPVILRDPSTSGAYSLWYTSPMSLAANNSIFQGTPGYSTLFHEMGHNFSLNSPAAFRYGGKIDGNANAIFSEAVAQMFQHAVAYELVNNAAQHGIPDDLAWDIANSARGSARFIRTSYDAYIAAGMPFNSWNSPSTSSDETLGTFMTLGRQFMLHAEQSRSYVPPLTRTMRLLRTFDQNLLNQYAPQSNTAAAGTFRATLMVAALSYGFQQDLRPEFRALNFPVDDNIFSNLIARVASAPSAPIISSATAGNGKATILISPPVNTGGCAIISYTATCTAPGQATHTGSSVGESMSINVLGLKSGVNYSCSVTAASVAGSSNPSKVVSVTPLQGFDFTPLFLLLSD